ncbi:MAG: hypothetical protein ACYDAN_14050 [Candidatus Limnocylindrales bacterium]
MDAILGLAVVLALVAIVSWFALYRWDGGRGSGDVLAQADEWGDFLVRTYRGRQQSDAITGFVEDAEILAGRGYVPVGQSWGEGQWDAAYFLLALILCLFGIGLILLAYMAVIRPPGTLCVTYRSTVAR